MRLGGKRQEVGASVAQHLMQRFGDISRRQPADSLYRLQETEVGWHSGTTCRSPGDLDRVSESSQQDIGKQPAFAGGTKRVSSPPPLPFAFPCGGFLFIVLDDPWRKPGGAQRFPGGIVFVLHRKAFFVKQRIPVADKPLDEWKNIPVDRVDLSIALLMGAQIPALDPDLETSPGYADFGVDALSAVRIIGKPHFAGEHSRVAGKSLPSNSHVTDSIPVSFDVAPSHTSVSEPMLYVPAQS